MAVRLAALAHPARIEILKHIAASRFCCCREVVDHLDLAQSTVSQHLKILVAAGLVRFEPDRQRSRYEVDRAALAAQDRLWGLQGRRRIWFCGAYFGSGFHEDGLQSGLAVAEALGAPRRPWRVQDESGRIPASAPRELAA